MDELKPCPFCGGGSARQRNVKCKTKIILIMNSTVNTMSLFAIIWKAVVGLQLEEVQEQWKKL